MDAFESLISELRNAALARHFAVDCAQRVVGRLTDRWAKSSLYIAREHACGYATDALLSAAENVAWESAARESPYSTNAYAAKSVAWATEPDPWILKTVYLAAECARIAACDSDAERAWQFERLHKLLTDGVWTPIV
jgi:hypothetical protein